MLPDAVRLFALLDASSFKLLRDRGVGQLIESKFIAREFPRLAAVIRMSYDNDVDLTTLKDAIVSRFQFLSIYARNI